MIVPIGHEQGTVRRQPWATFGLMGLCVAAFLLTHFSNTHQVREGLGLLERAVHFYAEHPYLNLDPRLVALLGGDPEAALGVVRSGGSDFATLEQTELDGLTGAGFTILANTPLRRWGLVPGDFRPFTLLTHLFLHGGWLHLLGNLLFLYLAGPFLEDVWGRRFFTAFYFAAGVLWGAFFDLRYPDLHLPLVGASGAIAGVLGAFLVRHWKRRIRFFYWFGIVFRGVFSAPAWVMLPLWFGRELASAFLVDVLTPGGGAGVAYWAHVSGFGFGVLAAATLRASGWERRFLTPAVDAQLTVADNARLDRALARRLEGREDQAWLLLLKAARHDPDNPDNVVALWDAAKDGGRTREAAPLVRRLIRAQVRDGEAPAAYHLWRELGEFEPTAALPVPVEAQLAEALADQALTAEAQDVVSAAAERASPATPAGALVRLARLATGETRTALAALVFRHPEVPSEVRDELGALLPEAAADRPGSPPGGSGAAGVQTTLATPLAIRDGRLGLELEGGVRRALPLRRVRAVAAAAVDEGRGPPNLILDLLLEPDPSNPERLQVVRLQSRSFDPRRLAPAEAELEDAFASLCGAIRSGAGAPQLLGGTGARLPTYRSLERYMQDFLAVVRLGPAVG